MSLLSRQTAPRCRLTAQLLPLAFYCVLLIVNKSLGHTSPIVPLLVSCLILLLLLSYSFCNVHHFTEHRLSALKSLQLSRVLYPPLLYGHPELASTPSRALLAESTTKLVLYKAKSNDRQSVLYSLGNKDNNQVIVCLRKTYVLSSAQTFVVAFHHSPRLPPCPLHQNFIYYEQQIKRELKGLPICGCRCNERL